MVGTKALISPPDLAMLCNNGGDDVESSKQLLNIFDGPLSYMSGKIQSYTTIVKIIMQSVVVEIGSGLKIMLILVYSATILSIIDLVKSVKLKRSTK
jgi:hypothetical protein